MPIQAVIFDMEGVLVDSEIYWYECRADFARDRGRAWTMDDQRLAMGRNTVEWARVMQERLHIDDTVDEIIADMIRRVLQRYEMQLPLRSGALSAVHLAASRYRVALASGSPTVVIQRVMQLTGLDRVFEAVIYGDDIARGKPNPDIYLAALDRLGLAPPSAVGVEDSANGVRALKNAGMYAVAAPGPDFPLPEEVLRLADCTIDSLNEFTLELVARLSDAAPPS